MEEELRRAVLQASTRRDVSGAVEGVYARLQDAINARRPLCSTSGRCCRFEEFGHRLYVTTLELAKFVAELSAARGPLSGSEDVSEDVAGGLRPPTVRLPILAAAERQPTTDNGHATTDSPGCPFQVEGLCSVRTMRPFGCRVFFCDETAVDWQHEQYERHHNDLRRLHDELGVPYYYVEWRFALRTLGLGAAAASDTGKLSF